MLTIKTTGIEDYLDGGTGKIKVLVAGVPGSGKTRFASFAPKPIFAATEDGLMSVADRSVPYARITSEADMSAFLSLIEAEVKKPPAQRRFETVVIDTLDAYERLIVHHYLRKKGRDEMDGWEDWGHLAARMNGLIARLMLINIHVVLLCHVKEVRVKGSDPTLALRLKGDVRDQLPADFDFVGLLENAWGLVDGKRGPIRSITWEAAPHAPWLKCRGGGLSTTPVNFAEEDFTAILDGLRAMAPTGRSQDVATLSTEDDQAPPAPAGGVTMAPTTKRKPPPRAAPPVEVPTTRPVAAVPAAAPAQLDANADMEVGIAVVADVLGGTVISDTARPGLQDQEPKDQEPEAEQHEQADQGQTQLEATPTGVEDEAASPVHFLEAEKPKPKAAVGRASGGGLPASGTATVICGTARYPDAVASEGIGCGEPINLTLEEGRVVAVEGVDTPELVEIAGLRERAFLHNACYAKVRRARLPR